MSIDISRAVVREHDHSEATVRERPIIFSAPMIQAIRKGRKRMTRRIVNMDRLRVTLPEIVHNELWLPPDLLFSAPPGTYRATMNQHGAVAINLNGKLFGVKPGEFHFECPFVAGTTHLGVYGSGSTSKRWTISPKGKHRLWVRETFASGGVTNEADPVGQGGERFSYAADWQDPKAIRKWTSPIFMPRAASRILLEVTQVRLERVQWISHYDIREEGIGCPEHDFPGGFCISECPSLRTAWRIGWSKINGADSWDRNDWVWAITFERASASR